MTTQYLELRAKIWEWRFKVSIGFAGIAGLGSIFLPTMNIVYLLGLGNLFFCGLKLKTWSDLSFHQRLKEENEKYRKNYLNNLLGKNNV